MSKIPMKKLPYKIMLDRYSEKDIHKKTLKEGTIVVATVDETIPQYPQKEICTVSKILEKGNLELESLHDSTIKFIVNKDKVSIPLETNPSSLWDRMALANARNEDKSIQARYYDEFTWLLSDWKFVPGGRIMAMLGAENQKNLTGFNCFVIPNPVDSRHGAIESLDQMTEIMARGGGVGINLSTLRPRHAVVKGVNGTSSGSVSWGGGYSYYTGLIEQGGSRRGALLEGLSVWHPDIIEFIQVKQKQGEMLNANLSVLVTDEFMQAVNDDRDWNLEYPDTTFDCYNNEWKGSLSAWKLKGYPVKKYQTLKARDLWNLIIESNWRSAEPGIIWIERYNNLSNSWYFEEIITTNPCGEMGLPAWGVCNLGHINLSKIPLSKDNLLKIDWDYLREIIHYAVRFMDNVIDITPYFFEANKEVQQNSRRIGIGTMGLAELLINLKIRYGSPESLEFIDQLYKFIRDTAYEASVEISIEKGPFKKFDAEKYLEGNFIKQLPDPLKDKIREHGIRNVALLTQAPTGSTGTMCDTSTGIEPFYDWVYTRSGRLGTEIQYASVVEKYLNEHNLELENFDILTLPDYFVTAKELTAREHVEVMAVIQKYTDSSISKTVNCSEDTTVEELDEIYKLAYKLGCKGLTTYRDKCRDTQVLNSITEKAAPELKWGDLIPKPKDTIYRLVKFNTGCGRIKLMIGTSKSLGNKVIDIYTIVNSEGGCQLNIQGEAIAISKYLRLGGDIHKLLENSLKAGNCPSYQFKRGGGNTTLYGKSCFNGIVRAIVDFQNGTLPESVEVEGPSYEGVNLTNIAPQLNELQVNNLDDSVCPGCGHQMEKITGCWQCLNCGFSRCE